MTDRSGSLVAGATWSPCDNHRLVGAVLADNTDYLPLAVRLRDPVGAMKRAAQHLGLMTSSGPHRGACPGSLAATD